LIGNLPIGKITPQVVRQWRAELLRGGVSATMAAKAYRLLRAVLTTAVEDDKLLPRNPCRIKGAGSEKAAERPVLTVAQVFELADLVGHRPVGNVRKLPGGGYRLRVQQHSEMRTVPEVYVTRASAEAAMWLMTSEGHVDYSQDRRYRVLVLLAAFASLRWGEVTALRRCDLDLDKGAGRVRAAFAERSTGQIVLGPPK
jgi:integrase